VTLGLPGIYNVYNAVAAVGARRLPRRPAVPIGPPAWPSSEPRSDASSGWSSTTGARCCSWSRTRQGANEALRTLAPALPGGTLMVALNDRIADGRDVSWIWDVDLEATAPLARTVVCSGTRAADLAVRMRYAGVEPDRIEVVDDLPSAFDRACALAGPGGTAFVLPTYTAMLALQRLASDRGLTRPYWEARA
jgi:UDP-N-acetylmuramyl tripeptide synthase